MADKEKKMVIDTQMHSTSCGQMATGNCERRPIRHKNWWARL